MGTSKFSQGLDDHSPQSSSSKSGKEFSEESHMARLFSNLYLKNPHFKRAKQSFINLTFREYYDIIPQNSLDM